MKKIYTLLTTLFVATAAMSQTLNVTTGSVTYQFPASQTGEMTYADGNTLTIMNKEFAVSDICSMKVDDAVVADGTVKVVYNDSSATVTVAGNIAQYVTPAVSGAHVSIVQSNEVADEIIYTLSGISNDGEFYMSGEYKATVELDGLTLANTTPVYSGAAIHIQNGKRINVKVVTGTTNTLVDAAGGLQKGCLYIKGHGEFAQKGILNITGNVKHGIKTDEYFALKNATINILSAAGDGISCSEYFLMESGTINISNPGDDGIQCDLNDVTSTGETVNHEDEDSGNIYISGGAVTVDVSAAAAKGIKCSGNMNITGGTITVTTSGNGEWNSDDAEAKAACCLSADGNMAISGGTTTLTSTGSGGKGIKCDSVLTIHDGDVNIVTSGGLYYNNGSTENTNYTGNTDNVNSSYYSSPKGIRAGTKTQVGNTYSYSGGVDITGGTVSVTTKGRSAEGIESKNYLNITGGHLTINAYDDAINSAQDLTIDNGYVYARATNNDGIDANGNCYIKGGVVFAIGSSSPEVAVDANSEERKQLYFTGGTLVAIGGLESGSSLSQTCYSSSSWSRNTWYALYNGNDLALAFKSPGSGGTTLVVSTGGTTFLKSGVSVSGGEEFFGGAGNIGGTVSNGTTVNLSEYSSGGNNPGGNRPGGGYERP